jgi:hypothetical protein
MGNKGLVSFGVAGGRRIMPDTVYRGLVVLCGAVVMGFGLWFLWNGARRIVRSAVCPVAGHSPTTYRLTLSSFCWAKT